MGGAILGAALASIASDTMATSQGANLPTALIGGILMLWGARFAAGCTRYTFAMIYILSVVIVARK